MMEHSTMWFEKHRNISEDEIENKLAFLRRHLSKAEMWGQLVEEYTEMAQAASKMQRLCFEANKPRKSEEECIEALIEEHADVALCFELLMWNDKEERKKWRAYKASRWADCIFENLMSQKGIE